MSNIEIHFITILFLYLYRVLFLRQILIRRRSITSTFLLYLENDLLTLQRNQCLFLTSPVSYTISLYNPKPVILHKVASFTSSSSMLDVLTFFCTLISFWNIKCLIYYTFILSGLTLYCPP